MTHHFHHRTGGMRTSLLLVTLLGIFSVAAGLQTAAAEPRLTDAEITLAVERNLHRNDFVPSHLIDVKTEAGVVRLSGSVDNLLAKDEAGFTAEAVRGVRSVVNIIDVAAIYESDEKIAENVKAALKEDPATDAYEIEVTVKEGTVTLKGRVDSWNEKTLTEKVTKSVSGVKAINDKITVMYREYRPDPEIAKEIKRLFDLDPYLVDNRITVSVDNGEVTLAGAVGSSAEKRLAAKHVREASPRGIDFTDLKVEADLADNLLKRAENISRSDEEIKDAVEKALSLDPRTVPFAIAVHVLNGQVSLTGVVDNMMARMAAEKDAENTIAVNSVTNYLKVRSSGQTTNGELLQKVRRAFARDFLLSPEDFEIKVKNRKVFLYGETDSYRLKRHAGEVVAKVKGVAAIANRITMQKDWEWRPDKEIRAEIEDEYFWSIFVDGDHFTVSVTDGVATIKGRATNWSEYYAAIDNAFEAGARSVVSDMKVGDNPALPQRYDFPPHKTWYTR